MVNLSISLNWAGIGKAGQLTLLVSPEQKPDPKSHISQWCNFRGIELLKKNGRFDNENKNTILLEVCYILLIFFHYNSQLIHTLGCWNGGMDGVNRNWFFFFYDDWINVPHNPISICKIRRIISSHTIITYIEVNSVACRLLRQYLIISEQDWPQCIASLGVGLRCKFKFRGCLNSSRHLG